MQQIVRIALFASLALMLHDANAQDWGGMGGGGGGGDMMSPDMNGGGGYGGDMGGNMGDMGGGDMGGDMGYGGGERRALRAPTLSPKTRFRLRRRANGRLRWRRLWRRRPLISVQEVRCARLVASALLVHITHTKILSCSSAQTRTAQKEEKKGAIASARININYKTLSLTERRRSSWQSCKHAAIELFGVHHPLACSRAP